jgi:hypothetical protein
MEHQSRIDPTRKTAGAIYRDAQINGERGVIIGDVNHEICKGLIEDINEAIAQGIKELEGRPFYLAIYEKKDLALKKGDVRIRTISTKRPYPEHDSIVYKVIPKAEEVFFCWGLPHRSQMINMLNNPQLFPADQLELFKRWENMQLEYFGFMKDDIGNWTENTFYRGDQLQGKQKEGDSKIHMGSSISKSVPILTV